MKFTRPQESSPPNGLFKRFEGTASKKKATILPTSAWYQNLLLVRGEPSSLQRAYAIPYLFDAIGVVPGLQIHPNFLVSSRDVVQLSFNDLFGLTLGATANINKKESFQYMVGETTELGVTLHWDNLNMTSTIVRGIPYGTMTYQKEKSHIRPTVASFVPFGTPPIADGKHEIECSASNNNLTLVKEELKLYIGDSDYSWLIFFSEPAYVQCVQSEANENHVYLQVVEYLKPPPRSFQTETFVIRVALLDTCTTGKNPIECKHDGLMPSKEEYGEILRRNANFYPGERTSVGFQFNNDDSYASLVLKWDVQTMNKQGIGMFQQKQLRNTTTDSTSPGLLMFALPHHIDKLDESIMPNKKRYCKSSLIGPACLVKGSELSIVEQLPSVGLRAPRPPEAQYIPLIAEALVKDIDYSLPNFFQRGAGDTYFSGKMLAKLARIILIADEILDLCQRPSSEYTSFCNKASMPSTSKVFAAVERLQSGVEIWINGTAETPFVYDMAWGGLVSCGCYFNGIGCDNKAPNCPAFYDQGLNFGNAFYNDQHFHYGYHIYAASVVAHFKPEWGMKFYENILLFVRSIANPSKIDNAFPLFRHKDWYQGHSWASGIPLPPYLNGKNQESSSEAIAGYEAVALYGKIMSRIWHEVGNKEKSAASKDIEQVGLIMTATELRSTQRYWHVKQKDESGQIYPKVYDRNVVGILWSTMAQFGTWFGSEEYLPYGIQLLPLTPIAEERDELSWMNEMYYPFSRSCSANFDCTESGWMILQLAVLATIGYANEAATRVGELPDDSFTNAGGNGHSRSNTLWYIGTRPQVDDPIPMSESDVRGAGENRPAPTFVLKDCHVADSCTDEILDRKAGSYSCRQRISWLIKSKGKTQWEACSAVSGEEYPEVCGPCNPQQPPGDDEIPKGDDNIDEENHAGNERLECPSCSKEQCNSDLNRCPMSERTYVCTKGPSIGGCSGQPWFVDKSQCSECCDMTLCQGKKDKESGKVNNEATPLEKAACPPCPKNVCYGKLNQCQEHTSPYLCTKGDSIGGCSSLPWSISEGDPCSACCEIVPGC